MTRRGRIVLWSAGVLFVLFALTVGAVVSLLTTSFGRAQVRTLIVSALRARVHGSFYLGEISDGFLGGVTIDSIAIRDPDDSLFVSAGRVTVHYDVRDLFDRRIALRNVHAEHPIVYIRQHENGDWNFRRVFPSGKHSPIKPGPSFGDFFTVDSATLRDATFLLTLPWHPSAHLHGAARDSAIRFELHRKDHVVRRTGEGFARTWRWSQGNLTLVHARISRPDSAGMAFDVSNLSVNEADPPFLFHNTTASIRKLGDSVWIDVPHWDLPNSTGRGKGKIWWGSGLPVRYAIHVIGDSVAMKDVAWVYPTLPVTGGGKSEIDIHTEPNNPHLTDYVLSKMDVRSTRSHLLGTMTFTLGMDTLIVKDVRLTASPVNFDLLRTLNGKPFPYDWQGDITGTVRASGGNLGRFKVEQSQVTFADANVPGAITRGSGNGELNIFAPAFTAFHEFYVNVETLDLRTLQYLNKEFPRVNGTVSGHATLDSVWLDVRFHDADLTHQDGPGPVSHATGSGRVTWGEKYLTYDLDMLTDSLSFTTLSRSYPMLPIRGMFGGPIRVLGQSPDLSVTAALGGPAGTITYDGRVDADPFTYGAHGTGTLTSTNLRTLLDMPTAPRTVLNGTYTVDVIGDSLADLRGAVGLSLAKSTVESTGLDSAVTRLRLDNGLVHVDTLQVAAGANRVDAHGTVSTVPTQTGALNYTLTLGSFTEAARLANVTLSQPLLGSGTLKGTLTGTSLAYDLTGQLDLQKPMYGTTQAQHVTGTVSLTDIAHHPSGTLALALDSLRVAGFPFDSASANVAIADAHSASFRAGFTGRDQIRGSAVGRVAVNGARTDVMLDSTTVVVDSANVYHLTAPSHFTLDTNTVAVDSLLFAHTAGSAVALRDLRLVGDSIHGSLRTSGFSLAILELFTSSLTDLSGPLTANVDFAGTTKRPRLLGSITIDSGTATVVPSGTHLDHIQANIALEGDTIRVKTLSAETHGDRTGTLGVTGTVAVSQYEDPIFDLRAVAQNFRAVDKRGLASLDISTSTPLTLEGPYHGAVVHAGLRVDRGTIYIPELVTKRLVSLSDPELYDVIDTTVAQNRALLPTTPSEFTRNLRLENVGVNIGDDVWLRSAEANIKLGGSLNVTLENSSRTGGTSQLALDGELRALRGTYRLNVVPLVQPVFDVESGTLRFYGTPDLDPTLNITAINTVRKPQQSVNRQDVRIRATIGGTLTQPTLALSSADNLPLTQSDLLSYLITGEPAFALDYTTQQYVNQLAAVAIRSASSVISSAIPRSVFDVVELQTPGALASDAATSLTSPSLYNLLNTRAVFGKQLNNNLFLNFSTGFCAENFRNNLGLRLEYRFNELYTVLFGLEPGSSDLACTRAGTVSVQQTPPQVGVDFFKAWRF